MHIKKNPPREPDFRNLQDVLDKRVPSRPTLFELFLNGGLTQRLSGLSYDPNDPLSGDLMNISAHYNAGYDYVGLTANDYTIRHREHRRINTISMNDEAIIFERADFDRFVFPEPDDFDFGKMDRLAPYLPKGMQFVVSGPDGVLENVVKLTGYENLCYMLYDDPELVSDMFEQVGKRVVRYYEKVLESKWVGAIVVDDDWGFHAQTLLPADDLRRLVFPWYREITALSHASGRQVILHSCGNYHAILEDIIEDMKIDGRHSYEDKITPVEQAYEDFSGRLAVLGGIDIDFMATRAEEEIYDRCRKILSQTAARGGYALGTGNSIPEYISDAHYLAMIKAALEE